MKRRVQLIHVGPIAKKSSEKVILSKNLSLSDLQDKIEKGKEITKEELDQVEKMLKEKQKKRFENIISKYVTKDELEEIEKDLKDLNDKGNCPKCSSDEMLVCIPKVKKKGSVKSKSKSKSKSKKKDKVCPEGKVLNPKTGRCVKIKKPKNCPEGKVLNPKTKRCIKIKK